MKTCLGCGQTLPLKDYYRQAGGGPQSRCKGCHNAACAARKRADAAYKARQQAAKQAWNARNKARTRLHVRRCTGRLLWDPERTQVPSLLLECQEALWTLLAAINQARRGGHEALLHQAQ